MDTCLSGQRHVQWDPVGGGGGVEGVREGGRCGRTYVRGGEGQRESEWFLEKGP